jgi:hypothetical protein
VRWPSIFPNAAWNMTDAPAGVFEARRLQRQPAFAESRDLTRFMHGGRARLLSCPACGLMLRDEGETAHYAGDAKQGRSS